jgi:hypothetical protein
MLSKEILLYLSQISLVTEVYLVLFLFECHSPPKKFEILFDDQFSLVS